jgi:hypothetical protein
MSNSPDLTKPHRGRPRAPPGVSRSNRLVTFVTNNEFDQIKGLAEGRNLALSAMLHQLVVQGLSAQNHKE